MKNLYQWDLNQTIKITGVDGVAETVITADEETGTNTSIECHFEIREYEYAYKALKVSVSDNDIFVAIPNIVLQSSSSVILYLYVPTGTDGYRTMYKIILPVIPRAKPGDYVQPDDEDYISLKNMVSLAKAWADEAQRRAEAGVPGEQGPQGVPGPKGDTGPQGEQGPQGVSGVWIGSGTAPEGYNVQIDPNGDNIYEDITDIEYDILYNYCDGLLSDHGEDEDAHSTLFSGKADLEDGVVPESQLPAADGDSAGIVHPIQKTSSMINRVGVDENGNLYSEGGTDIHTLLNEEDISDSDEFQFFRVSLSGDRKTTWGNIKSQLSSLIPVSPSFDAMDASDINSIINGYGEDED